VEKISKTAEEIVKKEKEKRKLTDVLEPRRELVILLESLYKEL